MTDSTDDVDWYDGDDSDEYCKCEEYIKALRIAKARIQDLDKDYGASSNYTLRVIDNALEGDE
jgi:hypothetical protein